MTTDDEGVAPEETSVYRVNINAVCPHCDHHWEYAVFLDNITCPSCGQAYVPTSWSGFPKGLCDRCGRPWDSHLPVSKSEDSRICP